MFETNSTLRNGYCAPVYSQSAIVMYGRTMLSLLPGLVACEGVPGCTRYFGKVAARVVYIL